MRSVIIVLLIAVAAGLASADPPVTATPSYCQPPLGRWAIPSDTGSYIGDYVGGGSNHPFKAEPRRPDDGTWGWDYQGWLIPRRVFLGWWHGQRYQQGTGSYRTDGPHLYHE